MRKSEVVKKVVYLSLLNKMLNTLMNINENWVDQRNSTWNAPYTFSGKEKDDVDRFVIKDKNKQTIAESKDFAKVTVKGNVAGFKSATDLPDATLLATDNSQTAEEIFQFRADNTNVEWGLVISESENCTSYLGTNHERSSNNIPNICIGMGYKVERYVHNHPSGNNFVSEGDHYNSIEQERCNPNVQLYNYTKSNGYTRYNSNTYFSTKFHGELDSFQISVPSYKTN